MDEEEEGRKGEFGAICDKLKQREDEVEPLSLMSV